MAARRMLNALAGLDQQGIAGGVAERVVDHLELVEVEAVEREQAVVAVERAEQMFELLLEHASVGQPGQDVVEGELGDALLALGDLADHLVEAGREPRELVAAAHPHLDMLAGREPAGGFVEPRQRLGDAPRRAPCREARRASRPSKVMTAKRQLKLARVGRALRPWDRRAAGLRAPPPEKVGSGLARAIDCVAPTCISNAAPPRTWLSASKAASRLSADMLPAASDHRSLLWARTAAWSGIADKLLEPAHFARIEVGGEDHPAEQRRRHDRRRDQLARPAGKHRDSGQATARRAAPTRRAASSAADRPVDRRRPCRPR